MSFVSKSGIGGLKTDTCRGDYDCWIVKLDSNGDKEWDKTYGGINYDGIGEVIQTPDNGYLLAGGSSSPISGDKTSEIPGTGSSGDMWLVKIDSLGNKIWDKEFGGSLNEGISSIIATFDGNYVLYGTSNSAPSGNKTAACKDTSIAFGGDYWLVKVGANGNLIWDKSFGGFSSEGSGYGNIIEDKDKGLIMSGMSYSDAGADKSENNILTGISQQIWIVKSDSIGNKLWDKTVNLYILQGGYSRNCKIAITNQGCFLIQTGNNGGIGAEKSQLCWDTVGPSYEDDYWVVKYCDTTFITYAKIPLIQNFDAQVYPNPFKDFVTLNINKPSNKGSNYSYTLKNSIGQILLTQQEKHTSNYFYKTFSTEQLPSGLYLLELIFDEQRIVKKVVKM